MNTFYKNALDHARTPAMADKVIHCAARCNSITSVQWNKLKIQFDHKPMIVARRFRDERIKIDTEAALRAAGRCGV